MKLKASVNDQDHNLTIHEVEGGVSFEIDGRHYEIQVHHSEDSSYVLIHKNQVYDCRLEPVRPSRDSFQVSLRNQRHLITIIDPRRLRTDENSERHHHGPTEIAAQMPGKVVRVLVEAGSEVEKGTGIVIVEAMKMQNEIKSPREGIVVSVNVKPGDTVNAGDVLATVGERLDA